MVSPSMHGGYSCTLDNKWISIHCGYSWTDVDTFSGIGLWPSMHGGYSCTLDIQTSWIFRIFMDRWRYIIWDRLCSSMNCGYPCTGREIYGRWGIHYLLYMFFFNNGEPKILFRKAPLGNNEDNLHDKVTKDDIRKYSYTGSVEQQD